MDREASQTSLALRPHPFLGALGGLIFGVLNVLFVLVVRLFGGASLERNGLGFAEAAGIYLIGGTIGGVFTGLLLPLLRWRLGAVVVGTVAASPILAAIATTLEGAPGGWPGETWFATVLVSAIVGGGIALTNWRFIQGLIAKWPRA